jgi:hypothetical protein
VEFESRNDVTAQRFDKLNGTWRRCGVA